MSVASCTKTAAIYAQSWTAGLPNYMYVHFKDAFGNNVQLQASRLIAVASYVVQPAPPVVVTIAMESNNYIADINAYANRSGSVNFRLSLDSEPNNPFFNFVATVSPSLFSASQSYATLGAIANSHEPFTSVSYASKSASIQPWYEAFLFIFFFVGGDLKNLPRQDAIFSCVPSRPHRSPEARTWVSR